MLCDTTKWKWSLRYQVSITICLKTLKEDSGWMLLIFYSLFWMTDTCVLLRIIGRKFTGHSVLFCSTINVSSLLDLVSWLARYFPQTARLRGQFPFIENYLPWFIYQAHCLNLHYLLGTWFYWYPYLQSPTERLYA